MAAHIQTVIKDDLGKQFDPASLPHVYTYDENGNLETDSAIEAGSIVRTKTYSGWQQHGTLWLPGAQSAWVVQS
ncbi:hypothetical protein PQR14_22120 [Paraburkholderia bryophila]|uniref:hypothetical protein n=1 Tax=Paraburkholderia bryophila TaxID=420952 RepID=UPI0038B81C6E